VAFSGGSRLSFVAAGSETPHETAESLQPATLAPQLRNRGLRSLRRITAHRSSRAFVPVVVGLVAFVVTTTALVWANHDRPLLRIEVTFSPQACCSWQVWIGGQGGDLTILEQHAASTAVYAVPIYRQEIDRLFVTTGTQPGGRATVRRIWITRGTRTVDEVPQQALQEAVVQQAKSRSVPGGLELIGTGTQPGFVTDVSLHAHEGRMRLILAHIVSQPLISLAGILLVGSLALAFLALDWRRCWVLAAALGATFVAIRVLPWLGRRLEFHDDVSNAVGFASYVGEWKSRERFVFDMAAALAVLMGGIAGLAIRRRGGVGEQTAKGAHPRGRLPTGVAILLVVLPVLVIGLFAAPNLRSYIGPPPQYVPSWDGNNFLFWQYLIQTTDLEPVRDFYWVYGFQWVFGEAPPWGVLASYGWFLSFWVFLALGTYMSLSRFFARRGLIVRYALLSGLWLTAILTSAIPFSTRYIGPLGAVLLFAGIDARNDPVWSWRRIVFAVALVNLTLFEPAQAGYALVPIAFLAAVELIVASGRREFSSRALRALVTIGAPLCAAAAVFLVTGTARETVELYKTLLFASSAYAFPTQLDTWISHPTTIESLIFWAVPLTLALGVSGLVARRGRKSLPYAVTTALGLLGFMILQKQILRPHIAPQVWLTVMFGLAYWSVVDSVLIRARRWPAVLAVAGAAGAIALASGGYRDGWDTLTGGPSRVRGSIHALLHDRPTFSRQADQLFTPSAFVRFSEHRPVARALRRVASVRQGQPIWILGDDTPIAMMLGRTWPYYLNDMYDASPINYQKKILKALALNPPARVVWNFAPQAMVYDAVPMPVRVPLLYEWAARNLVPTQRVGTFEILRLREGGEPVDLSWWRRRIGMRLDLGRIPAAARLHGKPCLGTAECASYLKVELPRDAPRPPRIVIPARVDGLPFEIAFQPGPESTYVIPLNRVWFWTAGTGERRIDATPTDGVRITPLRRTPDENVLY
jgi:hypothetical protein